MAIRFPLRNVNLFRKYFTNRTSTTAFIVTGNRCDPFCSILDSLNRVTSLTRIHVQGPIESQSKSGQSADIAGAPHSVTTPSGINQCAYYTYVKQSSGNVSFN